MKTLISKLREVKCEDVLSYMYRNVGSGYHLKHCPERQTFWDACIQTKALDSFVNALFDEYLGLVDGLKSTLVYWCNGCVAYNTSPKDRTLTPRSGHWQ